MDIIAETYEDANARRKYVVSQCRADREPGWLRRKAEEALAPMGINKEDHPFGNSLWRLLPSRWPEISEGSSYLSLHYG